MPTSRNCPGRLPPGPRPRFHTTMELALRDDQDASLRRIAAAFGVPRTEVARWLIDQGVAAIEATPSFATLEELRG